MSSQYKIILTENSSVEGNLKQSEVFTGDEDMFTWYDVDLDEQANVDLDEEMAKQDDDLADFEWEGYVADKVWQVTDMIQIKQELVFL